jgi:hypothetical protein
MSTMLMCHGRGGRFLTLVFSIYEAYPVSSCSGGPTPPLAHDEGLEDVRFQPHNARQPGSEQGRRATARQ